MTFVRPDVQTVLDMLAGVPGPQMHEGPPEAARQGMTMMVGMMERPRGDLADVRDITIPGDPAIPARVYRASDSDAPAPVLVFYHGGGWVIGDLASHDSACAEICRGLGMTVVAIDYRLAPEHRYPAAVVDCLAATRWIAGSPTEIGHPVTGLVPAGDSAGGNLAAVVCQQLAGTLAVPILAQWLIYPGVDMTADSGSMQEFAAGHLLTRETMAWFMAHYLGDADPRHPHASPLFATSLAGQPPALVFTCGLDPLRDQGRAYAGRLIAAGVPTVYRESAGQIHGSLTLRGAIASAQDDLAANLKALRALLEDTAA